MSTQHRTPRRRPDGRDRCPGVPPRLVVIDDSRDFRMILRLGLDGTGFEVVAEACGGRRGLEAVREHQPDVVVTDLQMPDADGLWVIEQLRSAGAQVPIVLLTGAPEAEERTRALAAGASRVVEKRSDCLPQLRATLLALHDGGEAAHR